MPEEIKKSINITIMETKEKLMQVIVQSQLPASISEMIIREVAENVSLQARQLLKQDRDIYQKLLQEAHKKAGAKDGSKERTGK